MTGLRVAMVSVGGLDPHVSELAQAVARRGHEVHVYIRRDGPHGPDSAPLCDGATVEHVPTGPAAVLPMDDLLHHLGDFGRRLAERWSDRAPDVVHAHYWTSGLAALTATADTRLPVVVTFHVLGSASRRHRGGRDTGRDVRLGLERTLGQLADGVVALSADEADELARMGVPRPGVHVVPSGVDTDRFAPVGPAMARGDRMRRVLSAGQPVEDNGLDDLIRAMTRVPRAELVIAGGPPPDRLATDAGIDRLRDVARTAGVADRVRFLGAVPTADMPAWYRSADLVCCPAPYAPSGRVALEAMACGVPVVACAAGAPAESVIDGVTGLHVPPRDVAALAGALRGLLADSVRRISYANAAVDRVRSRYTWTRAAEDVERLYESLRHRDTVAAS
jgi:glycosyltransferase involved in cell wall biosynthesis